MRQFCTQKWRGASSRASFYKVRPADPALRSANVPSFRSVAMPREVLALLHPERRLVVPFDFWSGPFYLRDTSDSRAVRCPAYSLQINGPYRHNTEWDHEHVNPD